MKNLKDQVLVELTFDLISMKVNNEYEYELVLIYHWHLPIEKSVFN